MKKIILIGAQEKGFSGQVLETIRESGKYEVIGFLDNDVSLQNESIRGIPVLGLTDDLEQLDLDTKIFYVAVADNVARDKIINRLRGLGNNLVSIIDSGATINNTAIIGEGCYIGSGTIIANNVRVGEGVIIEAGCIVQQHTILGDTVSLSTGVKISSNAVVESHTHIGVGASILSRVSVGSGVLIESGAVVKDSVLSGSTMASYSAKNYPKDIIHDVEPDVKQSRKIYVAQPTLPDFRNTIEKFENIYQSKQLSNFARYSNQLEINIQDLMGVDKALTFPNCTSALMMVLKAMELDGEVILPSFTFIATGHAVLWNNLIPVFADIDPDTFNIDPLDVECKITEKTSAIIAVNIFGNPCDISALAAISEKHGLKLIYDSAHALGSEYSGNIVGGYGDAECFSLSGTKVITSAEGGIVTSNNSDLMEKISLGRNYGAGNDYNGLHLGLNGKMSEFHAAIAVDSLVLLKQSTEARNSIVEHYISRLSELPGLKFQEVYTSNLSTYKDFGFIVDREQFGLSRDELIKYLNADNIFPKKYFYPPLHEMTVYKNTVHRAHDLKVTDHIATNIICLPIFSHMSYDTVEKICFSIFRIHRRYAK